MHRARPAIRVIDIPPRREFDSDEFAPARLCTIFHVTPHATTGPGVNYDLCMTLNGEDDATSSTLTVSVVYTAGD